MHTDTPSSPSGQAPASYFQRHIFFCINRRDNGEASTACADACAAAGHHAIVFGDLKDPQSAVSKALAGAASRQIRADLELNTGVRYSSI